MRKNEKSVKRYEKPLKAARLVYQESGAKGYRKRWIILPTGEEEDERFENGRLTIAEF